MQIEPKIVNVILHTLLFMNFDVDFRLKYIYISFYRGKIGIKSRTFGALFQSNSPYPI